MVRNADTNRCISAIVVKGCGETRTALS